MLANLRHAASTGTGAHIGGGDFTPAECTATADRLEQANRMERILFEIVGQDKPNRYGYDAAGIAMNDDWRARARASIKLEQ